MNEQIEIAKFVPEETEIGDWRLAAPEKNFTFYVRHANKKITANYRYTCKR